MGKQVYKEGKIEEFSHLLDGTLILLVTATDTETTNAHKKINPLDGYDRIIKVFSGAQTYYLGKLGNYSIVHVQSAMGSMSRASSIMTTSAALKLFRSKIVVMVGIAFGVDESKQIIGDVLVSESIIPYNAKRIGKVTTIQRGIEVPSNKILLDRFKGLINSWDYPLESRPAKLIPTRMLSGEELIDNLDYRNDLLKNFPESEGGEMEGVGVSSACDGEAAWIVIKGICDFADGLKGKNKKERQTIAINSALNVVEEAFKLSSAFDALNVFSYSKQNNAKGNIVDALFDIYDISKDPYYLVRENDEVFNNRINDSGIWIFGPSGSGKSTLIYRNVLTSGKPHIQVSLQACVGESIEHIFNEILFEVASKVEGLNSIPQPKNFRECSQMLIEILKTHFSNKELVLIIEEIPISDEDSYKSFAVKIFSILISKGLDENLKKIKIVLSSINNPEKYIQDFQQKIYVDYCFMPINYWDETSISDLICLIENQKDFNISSEFRKEIIAKSKGSPRFIKKFFRSVLNLNKSDISTLKFVLGETDREFKSFRNG